MNRIKEKLAAGQVVTMFNPDFAIERIDEIAAVPDLLTRSTA